MVRSSALFVCVLLSGLSVLGCGDSKRSNAFTALPPGLQITTASLPDGNVGSSYSRSLSTANGQSPYTWAVVSGSLPTGLDLGTSNGDITGTPTAGGASNFRVRVTDGAGEQSERDLTILVSGPPVEWKAGFSFNPGVVGQQYAANLNQGVTGGTQPITFDLVQGALPPGLTLSQSGVLMGTPTQAGTFPVILQATSSPDPATGARSQAQYGGSIVVN